MRPWISRVAITALAVATLTGVSATIAQADGTVVQYRVEIKCLNDNGLKVTPLPNGGGYNYDGTPTMSQDQQTKVEFDCRKKAYGAQ